MTIIQKTLTESSPDVLLASLNSENVESGGAYVHGVEGDSLKPKIDAREIVVLLNTREFESLAKLFDKTSFSHVSVDLLCLSAVNLFIQGAFKTAFNIVGRIKNQKTLIHSFYLQVAQKLEQSGGEKKDWGVGNFGEEQLYSQCIPAFFDLIENKIIKEQLDEQSLYAIGKFIEFGLNSPQNALDWYNRSRQAGGMDATISAARIYFEEGEKEKAFGMLESHFELPVRDEGYDMRDFERECRVRESAARLLISHYLQEDQLGNAFRIWFELRARKLLLPDTDLYLPQLRLRENSIEQTSTILNTGCIEPLTASDVLQYSEHITQLIRNSTGDVLDKSIPLHDIVASACMLRNVEARNFLVSYIYDCLIEGERGIGKLVTLVDVSMPEGLQDELENFGVWEWSQVEVKESELPVRRVYLRNRLTQIFAAILEDCIFETDTEAVNSILKSIEWLYPAHVGSHAAFSSQNIPIVQLLEDRLQFFKQKYQAINSSTVFEQSYLYGIRHELDVKYGKHARILSYRSFVDDGEYHLDLKYIPWLFGELLFAGEYSSAEKLLQSMNKSHFFEKSLEDTNKEGTEFVLRVLSRFPDIFINSFYAENLPKDAWKNVRFISTYYGVLIALGDDDFVQEFAHFENILLDCGYGSGEQNASIDEIFPGIEVGDMKIIQSAITRATNEGFESYLYANIKSFYQEQDGFALYGNSSGSMISPFLDIFQNLSEFLLICKGLTEVDMSITSKQFENTDEITWFDRVISGTELQKLQRYVSLYSQYTQEQKNSISPEIRELLFFAQLYLAYGNANGLEKKDEVMIKLSSRRLLAQDATDKLRIDYLNDYWNLLLIQFEGGILGSPQNNPQIAEFLLQFHTIEGGDNYGMLDIDQSRYLLSQVLLLESQILVETAAIESQRGDILAPLFARLSKIFLHWFSDVKSSESFEAYAQIYDPGEVSFHRDLGEGVYIFPVAHRLQ